MKAETGRQEMRQEKTRKGIGGWAVLETLDYEGLAKNL